MILEKGNMRRPIVLLIAALVLPIGLYSCKDEEKPDFDREDELARLNAYRELHYPEAVEIGQGVFEMVLAEGTGESIQGDGWLKFDYEAYNLDGVFLGTTLESVAKENGRYQRNTHYIPVYRDFSKEKYGDVFYETLRKAKMGSKLLIGLPSYIPRPADLWKSEAHTSVLCTLMPIEWIPAPHAYQQKQIEEYIQSSGLEWEGLNADSIKRTVIEEGDGLLVQKDYTVWITYAGYFLDGKLFDTNIKELAQKEGLPLRKQTLFKLSPATSKNMIKGFKGICDGLKVNTKFKALIPSELAYGEKGNRTIGPWEPLVFEIFITRAEAPQKD